MRKIGLLLTIFACLSFSHAEAIIDAIKYCVAVNSARYKSIKDIITNTLATQDMKWQEIRTPYPDKYESWSAYAPVYENKNDPKTVFQFIEYHHADHPTLRTIEDIYQKERAVENNSGKYGLSIYENERTVDSDVNYKCNLLYRDASAICFEVIRYTQRKTFGKVEQKKRELFSEDTDVNDKGLLENEEIKPTRYTVFWLVDLGSGEFRQYSLRVEDQPSESEKQNILNRFFRIEEQIRNVRS